jgi:hypothetical protein
MTLHSPADHRRSCLHHCYTVGVRATAKVLSNASTDHRPVVLTVKPERVLSDVVLVAMLFQQNFKYIRSADLEEAIERHRGLNKIYRLRDVNDVATSIVAGITRALEAIRGGRSQHLPLCRNAATHGEERQCKGNFLQPPAKQGFVTCQM